MTRMAEIDELARQLVLAAPAGIPVAELKSKVLDQMPDANEDSVSTRLSSLYRNYPDIVRVRRGFLAARGAVPVESSSANDVADTQGDSLAHTQPPPPADDEVEGLDEALAGGLGGYPIDSVMIRTEARTVHDVLRRIGNGQFVFPDFQRDFVWDEVRQSRLIESALMRIPLPVIYLAETQDGKNVVVDGLQRLNTFRRFLADEQPLRLDHPHLRGKRFSELDVKLQNRIEDTNLILYLIDSKAPERVRLDIFERVNGGVPLTRQQMRNSLFNGPGTRWLRDRAQEPGFTSLFSKAQVRKHHLTMRDREFVNRWAAFRILGVLAYKGDMDAFLGEALERLNAMPVQEHTGLTEAFGRGVFNNVTLFDRMAFRRHVPGQDKGGVFNVSLFDTLCVLLSFYPPERVSIAKDALRSGFYALLTDTEFLTAITFGTNQRDRVSTRFAAAERYLTEVLGDP